jgi:hypothetical protein
MTRPVRVHFEGRCFTSTTDGLTHPGPYLEHPLRSGRSIAPKHVGNKRSELLR